MKVFIPATASPIVQQIAKTLEQQEEFLSDAEKAKNPFWIRTVRAVVQSCEANRITPKSLAFTSVSNGYTLSLDGQCVSFLMEKTKEVAHG